MPFLRKTFLPKKVHLNWYFLKIVITQIWRCLSLPLEENWFILEAKFALNDAKLASVWYFTSLLQEENELQLKKSQFSRKVFKLLFFHILFQKILHVVIRFLKLKKMLFKLSEKSLALLLVKILNRNWVPCQHS